MYNKEMIYIFYLSRRRIDLIYKTPLALLQRARRRKLLAASLLPRQVRGGGIYMYMCIYM